MNELSFAEGMPRCLWLTRQYPFPSTAGDLIYSGRLTQSFADAGAGLTVLCNERSDMPHTLDDSRSVIQWKVIGGALRRPLSSVLSRLPNVAHRSATPAAVAALSELLRRSIWDVVLIEHLGMGWALDVVNRVFP